MLMKDKEGQEAQGLSRCFLGGLMGGGVHGRVLSQRWGSRREGFDVPE